jgi:hypothetical protein
MCWLPTKLTNRSKPVEKLCKELIEKRREKNIDLADDFLSRYVR